MKNISERVQKKTNSIPSKRHQVGMAVLVLISLSLAACGSVSSPSPLGGGLGGAGGYGGTCLSQAYNQGGYNYMQIGFNGSGVYFDGSSQVYGGIVPGSYSQSVGQVTAGGGTVQGAYVGTSGDGNSAVMMNIQSTYTGGQQTTPYPTANVQGAVYLSPALVSAILYTFGGYSTQYGGYTSGYPGFGGWPTGGTGTPGQNWQSPQVCVTSVALDLHLNGYSLNSYAGWGAPSRVYLYINGTTHGTYLQF